MGRAKTVLQSEFPYNINSRCINREWFNIPMEEVWDIFSDELYMTNKLHNLEVHQFVLMANHFHLIASTPKANIDKCMHRLLTNVSFRLTRRGNRINQTFAGRYFKTILQQPNYFLNAYKYNYLNPVLAKICKKPEEYRYSTLNALVGQRQTHIPLQEDATLFEDIHGTLEWLNKKPSSEKLEAVRYALKRPFFRSKKNKKTNQFVLGANDTI